MSHHSDDREVVQFLRSCPGNRYPLDCVQTGSTLRSDLTGSGHANVAA